MDPLSQAAAAGAAFACAGVVAIPKVAGALVPWAMATFGTIVKGVGTIHAAGGVTATLQTVAAVGVGIGTGAGVVAAGAVVGAAVASPSARDTVKTSVKSAWTATANGSAALGKAATGVTAGVASASVATLKAFL